MKHQLLLISAVGVLALGASAKKYDLPEEDSVATVNPGPPGRGVR